MLYISLRYRVVNKYVVLPYKGQIFGSSYRKWQHINLTRCFNLLALHILHTCICYVHQLGKIIIKNTVPLPLTTQTIVYVNFTTNYYVFSTHSANLICKHTAKCNFRHYHRVSRFHISSFVNCF